jgi:hypothetical protein
MKDKFVYIPELDMFGYKIPLSVKLSEEDIHAMSLESLEKLKITQIDTENYEVIPIIEKAILNKKI